jgi:hypothetical protein
MIGARSRFARALRLFARALNAATIACVSLSSLAPTGISDRSIKSGNPDCRAESDIAASNSGNSAQAAKINPKIINALDTLGIFSPDALRQSYRVAGGARK